MPSNSEPTVLPLAMLRPGETGRVSHIACSGRQGINRKLTSLGLTTGTEVSVLNAQQGPLLIRIGSGRVALGRGMAQRVMVTLKSA